MNILDVIQIDKAKADKIQADVRRIFGAYKNVPGGMTTALEMVVASIDGYNPNSLLAGIYVGKLMHANEIITASAKLMDPRETMKMLSHLGLTPEDLKDPVKLQAKIKELL